MERINYRQVLPNEVIETTPNIVGYAIQMMVRKLSEELANVLCTHKEYIVWMDAPTIEDVIGQNSTEYKACIEYKPLIRCRERKHFNGDGIMTDWCNFWSNMITADGFCSYGEKETDHE